MDLSERRKILTGACLACHDRYRAVADTRATEPLGDIAARFHALAHTAAGAAELVESIIAGESEEGGD